MTLLVNAKLVNSNFVLPFKSIFLLVHLIINIKLNKNNIDTDYTNEANPFRLKALSYCKMCRYIYLS